METDKFDDNELIVSTAKTELAKKLQVSFGNKISSLDEIVKELHPVIKQLLNNDFKKLLNIAYRLDIDEQKFYNAINEANDPAYSLSEIIVERQVQKIFYRIRYRKN